MRDATSALPSEEKHTERMSGQERSQVEKACYLFTFLHAFPSFLHNLYSERNKIRPKKH